MNELNSSGPRGKDELNTSGPHGKDELVLIVDWASIFKKEN
jgi:hypothetical protein